MARRSWNPSCFVSGRTAWPCGSVSLFFTGKVDADEVVTAADIKPSADDRGMRIDWAAGVGFLAGRKDCGCGVQTASTISDVVQGQATAVADREHMCWTCNDCRIGGQRWLFECYQCPQRVIRIQCYEAVLNANHVTSDGDWCRHLR